ncbi:MAG: DEAD/DEAH box helicase, partial [Alphaproteobacteria bacterium]
MKFSDLGLSDDILQAVSDAGYETPTPIQAKAIPYVLMNRDLLGCAQTGTGKTASFTLPMIDVLSHGRARARMPRSLIIEPTRELAAQVAEQFEVYGKQHKFTLALLIGGVSFDEQNKALDKGVDVLIATPGRLLDHVDRGKVLLNDVKILVIDEADRMLDMGFIPDVEKIVSHLPKIRQTLFFSATMPSEIRRLSKKFLMNPKEVSVDPPASTAETVEQNLVRVAPRGKRDVLRTLLNEEGVQNALVFCNRKRDVDAVFKSMKQHGFNVGALHGDMDQYSRMEILTKFKAGETTLLVCSDVAARGLDIASVSHVFNFDVPTTAEDYVHRV